MPEVVEIAIYATKLRRLIVGKEVIAIDDEAQISGRDAVHIVTDVKFHGKVLWIELKNDTTNNSNDTLCVMMHLGLSGALRLYSSDCEYAAPKHTRHVIEMRDVCDATKYELFFVDPRNFGKLELMSAMQLNREVTSGTSGLARNVMDVHDARDWHNVVTEFDARSTRSTSRNVMKVLMDQHAVVAGLGNYLSAEILYNAKISPHRPWNSLNQRDIDALGRAVRTTIREVMRCEMNELDSYVYRVYSRKYDDAGNEVLADKTVNRGRTTYWVPAMQT